MALTKRIYVDGETIITAQNLNDIQDEIIAHESNKVPITRTVNGKALSSNITLSASDVGAASTSHASSSTTYGKGTSSNYGHVKVTDSLSDSTTASTGGVALSAKAGKDLKDAITNEILYFSGQTVSVATSAQIMRIPSSGTNSKITTDTVVVECYFENSHKISGDVTWTSYEGYIAFTGTCSSATTANVVLGKKGN